MKWRDKSKEILGIIKGNFKKDIYSHDRFEKEYWNTRSMEYLKNWKETSEIYRNYKIYICYNFAHESYVSLISEKIKNKRILGLGVGLGLEELHLLKMGGNVIFLDLSIQMLKLARRGAGLYNLAPILINSNAHFLPFKSESFDMIIGTGILHHLNMEKAAPELARILVPNGKAIFIEPLEQPEPLVYLRAMIPVKWRESRGGGVLSKKDLFYLWKNFGRIKIRKFHVLESLCRISNWLEDRRKAISNIDRLLLTAFPLLGCFARAGVIEIQKIRK